MPVPVKYPAGTILVGAFWQLVEANGGEYPAFYHPASAARAAEFRRKRGM